MASVAQAPYGREQAACTTFRPSGTIVVLSMYGGKGATPPYTLSGADKQSKVVSVTGSGTGDVTLVLSAYDSTIWDLRAVKSRVKAVLVSGYYSQGVAGLKPGVDVTYAIQRQQDGRTLEQSQVPCSVPMIHDDMYKIQQQAKAIRDMAGKGPRRWYGGYSPTSFDIDGGNAIATPSVPPVSSVRSDSAIQTTGMMPGNEGLRQMVSRGFLRPVDKSDINDWAAKGGELQMVGGPLVGTSVDAIQYIGQGHRAFLMTRPGPLPRGLTGGPPTIIIMPQGVNGPIERMGPIVYRLTGYPGVPRPSGRPFREDPSLRFMAMNEQAETVRPASQFVEWDAQGRVIKQGDGRDNTDGPAVMQRPYVAPNYNVMSPGRVTMPEPVTSPTVQEPDASRDMTPTSLVAALLFALGAAGLVLNRRRTGMPNYPIQPHAAVEPAREQARIRAEDVPASLAARTEATGEIDRLSASLQEAIDLSHDDQTALALLKFKRVILRAMQEPDYDEDIGDELDAIVERHMAETLSVYVRAAKRTSGVRVDVVEANLRQGVLRLTGRIEELVEEQSRRDADRLRQRSDFIRTRHPDANDLGDPA